MGLEVEDVLDTSTWKRGECGARGRGCIRQDKVKESRGKCGARARECIRQDKVEERKVRG